MLKMWRKGKVITAKLLIKKEEKEGIHIKYVKMCMRKSVYEFQIRIIQIYYLSASKIKRNIIYASNINSLKVV